jgi:hypothetical protein
MQVKAIQKVYYAGRDRNPGEVFEMDDRQYTDINILCVLGKIEKVATATAKPTRTYQTADLSAQKEPQEPVEKPKETGVPKVMTTESGLPTGRRYYRRRDMKAEE